MPNEYHVHWGGLCEVESRAASCSPLMTGAFCSRWRPAAPYRGFKFNGRVGCWPWRMANACRAWLSGCSAAHRRSGGFAVATSRRNCPGRATRPKFPPLARAQIVPLACLEPLAKGLHITPWSSPELARQAVADGIVPHPSARTVRRLLHEVDLQPHRTRYWKTAHVEACFKRRAEQILGCYANANRLREKGFWVVCGDEMPTPIRRAIPGAIEQQEFEYILIQDGDPSQTAAATAQYFQTHPRWRPRFTPAHAPWLNQAELLNAAFSYRYLKRRSWPSRQALIDHVETAWPAYNRLYAHPFQWTWTNQKMRKWFAEHVVNQA